MTSKHDTSFGDPGRLDPGIIGTDPGMLRVLEIVETVAPSPVTVLLTGESGTGKSLLARRLHARSERPSGPFVEVSCGALPETLLESELFGHVRGAFTDAHADTPGRFHAAHGGTILLDEINAASPALQRKLLRVLQERVFEPVGSTVPVATDVRVILASNEPLEPLVAEGAFRADLFWRVNVVSIELPPLRERRGDVAHLARHFLSRKARSARHPVHGIDDEAMDLLRRHAWPGNIRELENVIERAVVLAEGDVVVAGDLPPHLHHPRTPGTTRTGWHPVRGERQSLRLAIAEPERLIILAALRNHDWNRIRTAASLQIDRTTLYRKMKAHGLDRMAG